MYQAVEIVLDFEDVVFIGTDLRSGLGNVGLSEWHIYVDLSFLIPYGSYGTHYNTRFNKHDLQNNFNKIFMLVLSDFLSSRDISTDFESFSDEDLARHLRVYHASV